MTCIVSNPGPSVRKNGWAPSYGVKKVVPLATEVARSLKRESDNAVLRRWNRSEHILNPITYRTFKFERPTTERQRNAELQRQAKRMASGATNDSITACGVRRDPELEVCLYNAWMVGAHDFKVTPHEQVIGVTP